MEGKNDEQSHILVLFYPVQGHMNPMLQFSKRLAAKGQKVTMVSTTPASKTMKPGSFRRNLNIEIISDGSEQTPQGSSESLEKSVQRCETEIPKSLNQLIKNIKNNSEENGKYPLKFLVYHYSMPWAFNIAREHGIDAGPFYTTPASVKTICYQYHKGILKLPLENPTTKLPSLPPLQLEDLPSFLSDPNTDPAFIKLAMRQFTNLSEVRWIFHSTFEKLEHEVLEWMANQNLPVKAIGPTVPSMYLDNRLEDDKDYGLNLFEPNVEICMNWLDSKEAGSVVYASFGSLANLTQEQFEELAWGLCNSNHSFLWVVRESEKEKLPANFEGQIAEKGLVVTWCKQLQVLSHKAVGCFLTHCGWNSALEALSLGVPMVGMPHQADHPTVAKYVKDVWKVGVRVKVNEGSVMKEEISACIKKVMDKDEGKEFRNAALVWKELAREAMEMGGSSDKNIEEFLSKIKST
ncbi:mogroside IE synthase-like [Argentina anserina]|uniref:mogroside IE synthase-like n=1 Tax=Argentina anserina TaxID=57926 RepID=UPI00217686BF|nr:mogroside IE synthase-like [Potentilla anserina]